MVSGVSPSRGCTTTLNAMSAYPQCWSVLDVGVLTSKIISEKRNIINKNIRLQTCQLYQLDSTCQQGATNLPISSSCNKSVKIRHVGTCHLQTCYNLLKQLAASLHSVARCKRTRSNLRAFEQLGNLPPLCKEVLGIQFLRRASYNFVHNFLLISVKDWYSCQLLIFSSDDIVCGSKFSNIDM